MRGLVLTFPNNTTLNVEYIQNSIVLNEVYYKDLKPVENNCKLNVIYSTNLSNLLKQHGDADIIANVYDMAETLIFSGFLRKSFTFTKKQRNQPIALEIVSPSYLLDKELTAEIFKTSETLGTIINALGTAAGFSLGCTLIDRVDYFRAQKGDNIKTTITNLLYEFGYSFDFDNTGAFITYSIFGDAPAAADITTAFTGSNCLEQIQIKRTEKQYTGVTATWQKKEFMQEGLLYEDTTGATDAFPCSIEVAPRSYMYGDDNSQGQHYLQYDSTKGEVLYCTNVWPVVSGTYIDSLNTSYENCGDSVKWSAYNSSMVITATYHKFQWWGRAWVATSTNESKTTVTGDKSLEIDIKYLNDKTSVTGFINKLANYYRYSLFNVSLKSKLDIDVGSYCTVADTGTGTITGRVISKQTTYTGVYLYNIESISEFVPASLDVNKSTISRGASDGTAENVAQIKSITDSLQEQIDGIETGGTTCALDINSIALQIDDKGYTGTVQSFTVFVTLRRSENDLAFIIGNDDNPFYSALPAGWDAVVDGNKITFTIGEGVKVLAGTIKIPVIYTPILSETPFVDENGSAFVDENGNAFIDRIYGSSGTVWNLYLSYIGNGYGVYLGKFTTIREIENCNPNVSDFFVWAGTDKTATNLTYDKVLKQAQTYKYIGTGKTWAWEVDKNSGHMQQSLSDVLGIANADLQNNNSTVWEYLDHLTANSVYTDLLISNTAFIDNLTSTLINTKQLVTGSVLDEEILAAESAALNNTLAELGVSSLENHTIIENGYIKTALINAATIAVGDLSGYSDLATKDDANNYAVDAERNALVQLVGNENVSGVTIIRGGTIKTNLIDTDAIKATAGFFQNVYLSGSLIFNQKIIYSEAVSWTTFAGAFVTASTLNPYLSSGAILCSGWVNVSNTDNEDIYKFFPTYCFTSKSGATLYSLHFYGYGYKTTDTDRKLIAIELEGYSGGAGGYIIIGPNRTKEISSITSSCYV